MATRLRSARTQFSMFHNAMDGREWFMDAESPMPVFSTLQLVILDFGVLGGTVAWKL
jgi:hypothetical protein